MEIIFSKTFKKQAQKLVENRKNLKEKINDCIKDFSACGRQSPYYRKKLRGDWFGYEELQIGGDIRIIIKIRFKETEAVFEEIGTHSYFGW